MENTVTILKIIYTKTDVLKNKYIIYMDKSSMISLMVVKFVSYFCLAQGYSKNESNSSLIFIFFINIVFFFFKVKVLAMEVQF